MHCIGTLVASLFTNDGKLTDFPATVKQGLQKKDLYLPHEATLQPLTLNITLEVVRAVLKNI